MTEDIPLHDYYADLEVDSRATAEQIKAAFHRLAKLHHPDKNGDASEFRKAREAYEKLSDPDARAAYDRFREISTQGYRKPTPIKRNHNMYNFTRSGFRYPSNPSSQYYNQPQNPFASHFRSQSTPQTPQYRTAHGVRVVMTEHPATKQPNCPFKVEEWRVQSGTDHCIFCLSPHKDTRRCPGCEALACDTCLKLIIRSGKSGEARARPTTWYRPAGG